MSNKITVQVIHFIDTTEEALQKHLEDPHMPLAGTNRYEYQRLDSAPVPVTKTTNSRKETKSNASKQRTTERDDKAGPDSGEATELVSEDANGRESTDADQQAGRDEQSQQPDQPAQQVTAGADTV